MKKSTVVWMYVIIVNLIFSYMLQIKLMPMNFWVYMLCSSISYAIGVVVINIIFGQIKKTQEKSGKLTLREEHSCIKTF